MPRAPSISTLREREAGMAIVEVIVAAVILGLAFTGVSSMLASGRDAESLEHLRRQAVQHVMNALEDTLYLDSAYSHVVSSGQRVDSIALEGGKYIKDTITVTVGAKDSLPFQHPLPESAFVTPRYVAFKKITAMAVWSFSGQNDTVKLMKRIAQIP